MARILDNVADKRRIVAFAMDIKPICRPANDVTGGRDFAAAMNGDAWVEVVRVVVRSLKPIAANRYLSIRVTRRNDTCDVDASPLVIDCDVVPFDVNALARP